MSKIKEILRARFPVASSYEIDRAAREIEIQIDQVFNTYGYLANVREAIGELFNEPKGEKQ